MVVDADTMSMLAAIGMPAIKQVEIEQATPAPVPGQRMPRQRGAPRPRGRPSRK